MNLAQLLGSDINDLYTDVDLVGTAIRKLTLGNDCESLRLGAAGWRLRNVIETLGKSLKRKFEAPGEEAARADVLAALGQTAGETMLDAARRVVRERDAALVRAMQAERQLMEVRGLTKERREDMGIGVDEPLNEFIKRLKKDYDHANAAGLRLLHERDEYYDSCMLLRNRLEVYERVTNGSESRGA